MSTSTQATATQAGAAHTNLTKVDDTDTQNESANPTTVNLRNTNGPAINRSFTAPRHAPKTKKTGSPVNKTITKQIVVVERLIKLANVLVGIILIAAVIFVGLALHEMGYFGKKFAPTGCT